MYNSIIALYNAGISIDSISRIKHLHIHTIIDIIYNQKVVRRIDNALYSK